MPRGCLPAWGWLARGVCPGGLCLSREDQRQTSSPPQDDHRSGWYASYWIAFLEIIRILINFLGGLSLHLNHLIASRAANYDWPFGTLPFGLFGSNLDTRDLETYPRTYSDHFLNMSIFDDSRAV